MKRLTTVSLLMVFFFLTFHSQKSDVLANVFASQLKILNPDSSEFDKDFNDESDAMFTFYLNDTASAVMVDIIDLQTGASVQQIATGCIPAVC